MRTIGIIAEYNPFHNGHAYQIKMIKEKFEADNIIVIMSGDFVQRGTPAFTDKYLRTEMALQCGADMVFELPTAYATSSAESFAFGGISLLHSLGFVDGVCFGSETADLNLLEKIADFLINNKEETDIELKKLTKCGISYATAREQILTRYFSSANCNIADILNSPNNILAIEYLKAIRQLHSHLVPYVIKRGDNGYHDTNYSVTDNFSNEHTFETQVSASAIRKAILMDKQPLVSLKNLLPLEVYNLLNSHSQRFPVTTDMFSGMLYYKLLTLLQNNTNSLTSAKNDILHCLMMYSDVSEDIAARIYKHLNHYKNFTSFAELIKPKQYTYSRISRALLHIMLDIKLPDNKISQDCIPPYARLLGIHLKKSYLLKNVTDIPVITKLADAEKILETEKTANENFDISLAKSLLATDIFSANLYRNVINSQSDDDACPDEYRAGVVRIKD